MQELKEVFIAIVEGMVGIVPEIVRSGKGAKIAAQLIDGAFVFQGLGLYAELTQICPDPYFMLLAKIIAYWHTGDLEVRGEFESQKEEISLSPDQRTDVCFLMSLAYVKHGDLEAAQRILEDYDEEADVLLAMHLVSSGKIQEAMNYAQDHEVENDPEFLYALLNDYVGQEDYDQARENALKILDPYLRAQAFALIGFGKEDSKISVSDLVRAVKAAGQIQMIDLRLEIISRILENILAEAGGVFSVFEFSERCVTEEDWEALDSDSEKGGL